MNRFPIASANDVRRVEGHSFDAFMAYESAYEALVEVASRHGDRKALTYVLDAQLETPARSWTYDELLDQIRRSANLFHRLAGAEQPRVAMLLPAIPEAYLTLWGAETAGMICPINYLLDEMHIAELIRASGANILVALGPHPELDIWSRVEALESACPGLRHVLAVGGAPGHQDFAQAIEGMPASSLDFELPRDRSRIAALFHTGGTTGAPKLAQHTYGNQLHSSWGAAQMYALDEGDVVLNGFPMFHVAGAFVYGLSALLSGAEIVLPTLLGLRNTEFVKRYWAFVHRHEATLLAAVPTVIATLLGVDPQGASTASVRALFTGGSPLPNELAGAFERKFGIPVRNILGMTECAGVVSIEPFQSQRTPGSCGIALPFTTVIAVAPDGRTCEPGESGILRLRGPNVGPGYTDARRNSGTFTDDGWLITGDIGHLDADGRVFVTGRAKDVIIRGAHNIDPQVIEEALLQHPDVLMAAAVGEPDEYAGELPIAFVSLRAGALVDGAALSSFANERIPERPAYPKRIEILPAIPTTAVGKVYKPQLRALACEHALRERIARAGLQDHVRVVVEDAGKGMSVRFVANASADLAGLSQRIGDLMRSFAIPFTFDGQETAPTTDGAAP